MVQQSHGTDVSPAVAMVLRAAASHAGDQLSLLLERNLLLRGTAVERVRLESLPSILDGEERSVTAVYLSFSGDLEGHVVLSFSPAAAINLLTTLVGDHTTNDETLSDMEKSALGEIGNITTAAFLNAVATACRLTVYPSPPTIVQDMIGALLDSIVVEMSMLDESAYAVVIHTVFTVDGDRLAGDLILLPSSASASLLQERLSEWE